MAGDMEAALVSYEHAANCDHAEAAYRAGVILTNAGDPWTAGYWLGKAASRGHPDADQHLDGIYDQGRGGMNTPPEPPPGPDAATDRTAARPPEPRAVRLERP